jgi:hypothetical protein
MSHVMLHECELKFNVDAEYVPLNQISATPNSPCKQWTHVQDMPIVSLASGPGSISDKY